MHRNYRRKIPRNSRFYDDFRLKPWRTISAKKARRKEKLLIRAGRYDLLQRKRPDDLWWILW